MNISVVVPTYNRPQALRLCLLSLSQQSLLPQEILIADDGSASDTKDVVIEMRKRLARFFPIHHVRQEDDGFRKPKILNEAVRRSNGDYLVFIDGDCMAHRSFIKAHTDKSAQDVVLSGKRVEIGKMMTEQLLSNETLLNRLSVGLIADSFRKNGSRKVDEAIRIRNKLLRRMLHRDAITNDGAWGCNLSLPKKAFIAINGCDEDFLDGSLEDNDIGIRAINSGMKLTTVRGLAIVFHLWHKASWSFESDKYQRNLEIIKRRIENREVSCKNGIYRS
jgi:glycosyltransferase involved in cell wall biosynthesis